MAKEEEVKKKSHSGLKYLIYILIVLVATGVSLGISLSGESNGRPNYQLIFEAFSQSDAIYILIIAGIIVLSYLIDGFIIFIFCRLYTRRYKFHQGLATCLVGQFYSDVTPGASGGQAMQIYTLKSQGMVVSNAASIMVMWFILYQSALLIFDVIAFIVEAPNILGLEGVPIGDWTFPMIPLIIIGFLLNVSVIILLFTMSFWHGFHNFILNHVVNFLAKIRILKKPEETRATLRVQVENFKIELKRLSANVPVVILILILFFLLLLCRFSIPYFAGMALHAWDGYVDASGVNYGNNPPFSITMMFDSAFLGAFHQMVTGLLPLPGSAGVSELFYNLLFVRYFGSYNSQSVTLGGVGLVATVSSTQILWRTATFHFPLVVSGLVSAFYRSRPKEPIYHANRKTFIALTMSTLTERQASADTMYETRQMSRKALQNRLNSTLFGKNKNESKPVETEEKPAFTKEAIEPAKPVIKEKPQKVEKPKKEKKPKKDKKDSGGEWETWEV